MRKWGENVNMYSTDHQVWRLLHVNKSILLFIFHLFYVSNKNPNWVETHQAQLGLLSDAMRLNHHSNMSIHLYRTRRPSSDFWEWIFYSHNGIESITIILASWEQLLNLTTNSKHYKWIHHFIWGQHSFSLLVCSLPGAGVRLIDNVWDLFHQKIKEGKSWLTRNPQFHRCSELALTESYYRHYKDISVWQTFISIPPTYIVLERPKSCIKFINYAISATFSTTFEFVTVCDSMWHRE